MKYLIPIILFLLIPGVIAGDTWALWKSTSPTQTIKQTQESQIDTTNILNNNLNQLKTKYNQNINKVPWIVKKIIGNERINVYLTLNNGNQKIIGGITNKARILQAQVGKISNPTLNIYITEKTIQRLINKQVTLKQAIKTKEITYKSKRIRTSIKAWFAKRLLRWF